eukprot:CAMPEP_0202477006 /NCGR_PEP_ID=MMETSP1360-20130828/93721_1 /ASSEMBLY_ACC=CAM_ASM_000848 /TAXON_ID=515479 /ORGANISM="Licmophora paradoxa, Strain CCMP2313" /LENGTH=234 /DNA_ID=CAMNT_0049104237 /DNA_START=87 /DNA_END=791 /DNA_ORIENTATION=+
MKTTNRPQQLKQQLQQYQTIHDLERMIGFSLNQDRIVLHQGWIQELDLSHLQLTTLPSSITNLINLVHLNLQHNRLFCVNRTAETADVTTAETEREGHQKSPIPDVFASLQKLRTVHLLYNDDGTDSSSPLSLPPSLQRLKHCVVRLSFPDQFDNNENDSSSCCCGGAATTNGLIMAKPQHIRIQYQSDTKELHLRQKHYCNITLVPPILQQQHQQQHGDKIGLLSSFGGSDRQ